MHARTTEEEAERCPLNVYKQFHDTHPAEFGFQSERNWKLDRTLSTPLIDYR